MAGTFIKGETKIRPGVYSRYENVGSYETGILNGVGAGVFRSNWGPLGKVVDLGKQSEVAERYGTGATVELPAELFRGGCTTVKAVRIGTGGKKGALVLKDTADSDALKITAKYVGDRAFTVSIRDSLINGDARECLIYEGSEVYEQVQFAKGDTGAGEPEALKAALAASPGFDVEVMNGGGSKLLQAAAQVPLEGGENPTSTVADYSAAYEALSTHRWNVMCVDTDEAAVHTLAHNFAQRMFQEGNRVMVCVAGTQSELLRDRMAAAAAFNDPLVVYVLNAAAAADGTVYEGWRLAASMGGMVAAVEASTSLTHTEIPDFVDLAENMTHGEIEEAIRSGCLVLSRSPAGRIWVEAAVNTLVKPGVNQDEGWKKIRRTKTRIELNNRIDDAHEALVGKVNNDADGRATLVAAGQNVINQMVGEKKLLAGGKFLPDPENLPVADSAWFLIAVDDIDSLERVYETHEVRGSSP